MNVPNASDTTARSPLVVIGDGSWTNHEARFIPFRRYSWPTKLEWICLESRSTNLREEAPIVNDGLIRNVHLTVCGMLLPFVHSRDT